jgi:hypothetical protein
MDPIGIAGGLNVYGFANGDPINFSDPFGLSACDPARDPDCVMVAQATGGVTLGSRGAAKLGSVVGLKGHFGITAETGLRQTVNRESGTVENDGVGIFKAGFGLSLTVLGVELGVRIGVDSEDPSGGLFRAYASPDRDGTIEVAGQYPAAPAGISGSYRINPFGALEAAQLRNGNNPDR